MKIANSFLVAWKTGGWERIRWLIGGFLVSFILILIAYRVYRDWRALAKYQLSFRYPYLFASLLPQILGLLLAVYSWGLIIRQLGGPRRFKANLRIYSYSNIAKVLPGSIWFILGRVYLLEREGVNRLVASTAAILEWLLLGMAGASLCLLTLPFNKGLLLDLRFLILLALLGVIAVHPRVFNSVANFVIGKISQGRNEQVRVGLHDTFLWFSLDMIVIALGGLALFFVVNTVYPVSVTYLSATMGAWAITVATSNLLFWLPGTIVLKEGIMILFLSSAFPTSIALVIAVLWRIWLILCDLLWAAVATRL